MKLYTEEQVLKFINDNFDEGCSQLIGLTPIELPSDSLCINCDKSESTHNICMDCIIKIGKENIELPSDEEMVKAKYEHEMCVFADEYASYVLEQSKPGIKGAMVSMCAWTFFKNRRNEQQ
jgi:hypothetical protein